MTLNSIKEKITLKKWVINYFALLLVAVLMACGNGGGETNSADLQIDPALANQKLPYWGEHDVEINQGPNGTMTTDTAYYTLPKFVFRNQENEQISHRDYQGKIFVAEFFFSHCKSICPIMSSQMVRLQQLVKKEGLAEQVSFLSHTVDPTNDTPDTLKAYGEKLDADFTNWNFVTGDAKDLYWQAESGYMLSAFPSDTADGGFFHTDKLTLVDREMHIRGYYDGTSTKEVNKLFVDIKRLINEYADSSLSR